jgi:hypothetical protein
MIVTPWDRSLATRTTLSFLALVVLTAVVLVATDEVGATWSARVARLAALAPALAALAVTLLVHTLDRPEQNELAALRCSGIPRWRGLLGSWFVAVLLGGLGAVALAAGKGSLDGLLPPPPSSGEIWQHHDGAFAGPGVVLEGVTGPVRFEKVNGRDDSVLVASSSRSSHARALRWRVAVAVGLFAVLLPLWSVEPEPAWRRAAIGSLVVSSAIVAFHAVAAGKSMSWLLAPPLLLGLTGLGKRLISWSCSPRTG